MRASPSSGGWTSCWRTPESWRSLANSGCTARPRGNRRHAERSVRHRQLGNPAHPRRGTRRCDCHHQLTTAGLYRGMVDGNPGVMGYIASKHGVVGLMRAWTNPLALERIRVNTVHPTGVNSPNDYKPSVRALCSRVPHDRCEPTKSASRREWIDPTGRCHEHDLALGVRHGSLHHRFHRPCRRRFHEQVAARRKERNPDTFDCSIKDERVGPGGCGQHCLNYSPIDD
jgi:NAD(P)-dependent dehydrogenase (short-subunit alcohol dehydrogenase family)